MKKLIASFVFILAMVNVHASETDHYDSLFTLGNASYQAQAYDTALQNYSAILESGLESSELYYNTANCYFKLGQPTQAILYYEKALKLNPQSKDIRYNLDLTNTQIVDEIESLPVPFFKEWWSSLVHSLPVDTFAFLTILFIFISVVFLLLFFRTGNAVLKRVSFFVMLVALVSAGMTYLFARTQFTQNYENNQAIIFSSRTNIYAAPNTTSTTLFIVHEGLKVSILKTENQWNQIMLPDGSIGWIPEETLVVI